MARRERFDTMPAMPKTFVLRQVPDEIWEKMAERSRREGWPNARAILVRLLDDYGSGKIDASEPPPRS